VARIVIGIVKIVVIIYSQHENPTERLYKHGTVKKQRVKLNRRCRLLSLTAGGICSVYSDNYSNIITSPPQP
jgi:hypothetical protein